MTIDFGWFDVGDELRPSRLFMDIRKRLWSWWNYKRKSGLVTGGFIDWVTWEAPNGKHHVNWKLHIPEALQLEAEVVIENRCGKVLRNLASDTVHQEAIWALNGTLFYALKGTEAAYATGLDIRASYQGEVWCRRASASRALGRAARERDWQQGKIVSTPKNGRLTKEARDIMREAPQSVL